MYKRRYLIFILLIGIAMMLCVIGCSSDEVLEIPTDIAFCMKGETNA